MAKTAHINLRIDEQILEAAKSAADEQDRSVSYIVRTAIKSWLADNGYSNDSD